MRNKISGLKATIVPIMVVILLLAALVIHEVGVRKNLAVDGWSRSATLMTGISQHHPVTYKDESGYTVYIPDGVDLKEVTVDESLRVTSTNELPVNLETKTPFWAKKDHVYYFQDGSIKYYDGSKSVVRQDHVDGMRASDEQILYWKGSSIYTLDPETGYADKVAEAKDTVADVFVNDSSSFLVLLQQDLNSNVILYKEDKAGSYDGQMLFSQNEASNQKIIDIDFTVRDELVDVIFTTYSTAQQQLSWRAYHNQFDLSDLDTEQSFKELMIHEKDTGNRLRNPTDIDMRLVDGTPMILFAAEGMLTPKIETDNIYTASLVDQEWKAIRISTTKQISAEPEWIDDSTVTWLDYTGKEPDLMAASNIPSAVNRLDDVTAEDWKQGFYSGLTSIGFGLILLIYAVIWTAPPFLFLFVISFFAEDTIEERKPWVRISSAGVLGFIQVMMIQKFFTPLFAAVAPVYLSFAGASYIVPIILLVLSWIATQFVKGEEWGVLKEFSYFTGINLLLVILLISPYVV